MSHHYTTRNPMAETRRHQVHGPLQPMEEWRSPSPGRFLAGVALGVGLFLLFVGIAAVLP